MAIKSKIDPQKEFIFSAERPGFIGIKVVGKKGTAWFNEKSLNRIKIQKEIALNFWQEVQENLENEPNCW